MVNVFIDTSSDHYHEIIGNTGPALYINGRKHGHLLRGTTTYDDGQEHDYDGQEHDYYLTTLVEDPTSMPEDNNH